MKKLVLSIALSTLVFVAICGTTQAAYYHHRHHHYWHHGGYPVIIALTGQGEAMTRSQLVERHLRLGSGLSAPQSSSASRFTAGAFGFLIFTQCGTSPER